MEITSETIYYDTSNYRVLKDIEPQTSDLYLSCCGIQHCEPSHHFSSLPRSEYLIHIILSGKGTFRLGNRQFALAGGQAFFVPPDFKDYEYCADEKDPWVYLWIGFNGTQADSHVKQTGLSGSDPVCTLNSPTEDIYSLMQQILKAQTLTLPNELRRVGYLYKFLALLIASHQAAHTGTATHHYPSKTYAVYAKNYINHNYSHACISELAAQIGIDRSYLHHVFKNQYQVSPQEYLISCRLAHASELLRTSALNIQAVSKEIGYEDSMQFSRIFKKHFGVSPRHYRQAARKDQENGK